MPATSNHASIKLYNVDGIARYHGNDSRDGNGCTWRQQFWGEIEDSAIESYYNGDDTRDLSMMANDKASRIIARYTDVCCVCHRHINGDAWLNLDGGDMACDSHVKIVTRAD